MFNWFPWRRSSEPRNSTLSNPSDWLIRALVGETSAAGLSVTPLKAMGVATVFACVNVVARTIATLPLKLYRKQGRTREEVGDHPLSELIGTAPNQEMSTVDWRFAMQGNLSLRGNAYSVIRRNGAGQVIEIMPQEPGMMHPDRRKTERANLFYKHTETQKEYQPFEILHLKSLSSAGLLGYEVSSLNADVIGLAMALQQNASKFFANSSRAGLTIEAPQAISDKAFGRLKDWFNKYKGSDRAYQTLFLEEGLKATQIRSDNTDSQFDESRARQDKEICRIFGIPPYKVGIFDNIPRANAEEQNRSFVDDVVLPFAVIWETAMNIKLLSETERRSGLYFKLDLRGLLRGSTQDRSNYYAVGRQWGWFSANDVRALEDLEPIENGDIYLQPMNMVEAGSDPIPEPQSEPEPTNRLNGFHKTTSIHV